MKPTSAGPDLDSSYELAPNQIERFREDGFIKPKGVFAAEALSFYGDEITQIVKDLNPRKGIPMAERGRRGDGRHPRLGTLQEDVEFIRLFWRLFRILHRIRPAFASGV